MTPRYIKNLKTTRLSIDLKFATVESDGLILWQGKKNSNWISAGLEDGYLQFTASFGQGELFVKSKSRYT